MNVYEAYLRDLGFLVRERAENARNTARQSPNDEFESGRVFALYEVISLMQQQAVAFQIPLDKVSLAGIDPDSDFK
jgi:hypothetical protein